MSVIKTTNVIDDSIYLKAKLAPNMVGDNYYIENLQDKRNQDWEYRYNRVFIEEELEKQAEYSTSLPEYTGIDTVITDVKGEKGEPLGTDWASLSFRDLQHPNKVGSRYRFSTSFPDMSSMTEEEKRNNTSIWIAVNRAPIKAGNSCVVRRCNTFITLLGYENRDRRKTKTREIHLEPVILESTDMKYTQIYYNLEVPVPQGEWYIITQLNYYTNSIKINDRLMFGTVDTEVRENNAIYKVKAVMKANTATTFASSEVTDIATTPLLILSVDKDAVSPQDDFINLIPNGAPVYLVPTTSDKSTTEESQTQDVYVLQDSYAFSPRIALGASQTYKLQLFKNDTEVSNPTVTYSAVLNGKASSEWSKYFRIGYATTGIEFTVTNLKTWIGGTLDVTVTYQIPSSTDTVEKTISIILGKA